MDMESTRGLTGESMKVNGEKITCTGKVSIPGKMAENTKESILTTRSTDMVHTPGQMAGNTRETGCMENRTVKEPI